MYTYDEGIKRLKSVEEVCDKYRDSGKCTRGQQSFELNQGLRLLIETMVSSRNEADPEFSFLVDPVGVSSGVYKCGFQVTIKDKEGRQETTATIKLPHTVGGIDDTLRYFADNK
jgi:hypothetical protein